MSAFSQFVALAQLYSSELQLDLRLFIYRYDKETETKCGSYHHNCHDKKEHGPRSLFYNKPANEVAEDLAGHVPRPKVAKVKAFSLFSGT